MAPNPILEHFPNADSLGIRIEMALEVAGGTQANSGALS